MSSKSDISRRTQVTRTAVAAAVVVAFASCLSSVEAQDPVVPVARLIPARTMSLPGPADSNSPAVWDRVDGRRQLFVFTSVAGQPSRHSGADLSLLRPGGQVSFDPHPGHGVWLEAVLADADGTWYGYYHHEQPAEMCADDTRTVPRIGALRSRDLGVTWEDLGIVLDAPPGSHDCESANRYFVGGVGDFSVVLDQDQQYLYFFYSQYLRREEFQGISVARMAWGDRDAPVGKVDVWLRSQTWRPARTFAMGDSVRHFYPAGGRIYAAGSSWHADEVDAFWGPSVHWNTHLRKYVMLLNRAQDASWSQEGIYVAFCADLSDPGSWSSPKRILSSGRWYPQVMGIEPDGTDRQAGEFARFFMAGRSEFVIQFVR